MTYQWTTCRSQSGSDELDSKVWNPSAVRLFDYFVRRMAARSRYGAFVVARVKGGNALDLQTYNCRSIRGSSSHSEHSHTVAMDIRPWENPLSDRGYLITDFDMFGAADGEAFLHSLGDPVPGVGPCWEWGGGLYSSNVNTWIDCYRQRGHRVSSGRVDAMHFQISRYVTPGDVASVNWSALSAGEEFLMALSEAEQDAVAKAAAFINTHSASFERLFAMMQGVHEGMGKAQSAGAAAAEEEQMGFRLVRKLSLQKSGTRPL